jgi:hypothetical protein
LWALKINAFENVLMGDLAETAASQAIPAPISA